MSFSAAKRCPLVLMFSLSARGSLGAGRRSHQQGIVLHPRVRALPFDLACGTAHTPRVTSAARGVSPPPGTVLVCRGRRAQAHARPLLIRRYRQSSCSATGRPTRVCAASAHAINGVSVSDRRAGAPGARSPARSPCGWPAARRTQDTARGKAMEEAAEERRRSGGAGRPLCRGGTGLVEEPGRHLGQQAAVRGPHQYERLRHPRRIPAPARTRASGSEPCRFCQACELAPTPRAHGLEWGSPALPGAWPR